jgi:hypothetical protein
MRMVLQANSEVSPPLKAPASWPATKLYWAPAKPSPIPCRILSALRRQVTAFNAEHRRHPRTAVLHVTNDGSALVSIDFEPDTVVS